MYILLLIDYFCPVPSRLTAFAAFGYGQQQMNVVAQFVHDHKMSKRAEV